MYVDCSDINITIDGPTGAKLGSNISIHCTILNGCSQLNISIVTPQGRVINNNIIRLNVTAEDIGNYTCVASGSEGNTTRIFSLILVNGMFCVFV